MINRTYEQMKQDLDSGFLWYVIRGKIKRNGLFGKVIHMTTLEEYAANYGRDYHVPTGTVYFGRITYFMERRRAGF